MKAQKSGILLLAIFSICYACKHDPFPAPPRGSNPIDTTKNPTDTTVSSKPCHPDTIYFERDVMPILSANCAFSGCHDASTASDGVILTDYNNVVTTADVEPFDLDAGKLYENITEGDPEDRMPPPPRSPLSNAEISIIRNWILQGAQNLSCSSCDTTDLNYDDDIAMIFSQSCTSCHGGSTPEAGLLLTTYTEVRNAVENGQVLPRIKHQAGFNPMPPSGIKLEDCTISKIEKWVAAGYPEN